MMIRPREGDVPNWNRRDMLKIMLATPMAATAAPEPGQAGAAGATTASKHAEMPNILWICTDQQRFDTIGGFNNPHLRTPNIRKLMDESVTCTHAFVQNPVCSPSRASFLSGRYPHTTGLRANGQRIRPSERLVTRVLADFGYECGLVGKLHLSPVLGGRSEDRIDDGYAQFWWSHEPWLDWPGKNMYHVWLASEGIRLPVPPKDSTAWGVPISSHHTQTAWCSDTAIRFLRQQKNFKPWLMSVNMYQPHHPFWPCEEYFSRYNPAKLPSPAYHEGELDEKPVFQRVDHHAAYGGTGISFEKTDDLTHRQITAAYYAMIEEIDTQVGRMLSALEETGQANNTIVIFMSDHGEMCRWRRAKGPLWQRQKGPGRQWWKAASVSARAGLV
jgi:arylsulfatase